MLKPKWAATVRQKTKIISRMSHHKGKDAGRERRELLEREIQAAVGQEPGEDNVRRKVVRKDCQK